jgi:hypothetical protein
MPLAMSSHQELRLVVHKVLLVVNLLLGNALEAFQSNMYSYALAKRMWNSGWGSRVYGNGELDEEYFNKIPKRHKL